MLPLFLSQRHSMAIHSSVIWSLNQPESIYKNTQTSTSVFPSACYICIWTTIMDIFPIMDTYLRHSRTLDTGEKQVPTKNTNLRHSRPSATVTRPAQSERSFSLGDSHVWKRSPSPYCDSSHQDHRSVTFPTQSGSRGGMSSSVEGFRSSAFEGPAHREPMRGRYTRVVGSRLVVSLDRDNTYSQGGMSSRAEGSHLGVSRVSGRPRGPRGGRSYSLKGFQQQIPAKDLSTNAQPLAQLTLNNARCFCRLWAGY